MPLSPKPSDLTIDQLRSLWLTNRDPNVRRALEELVYRRREAEHMELALHGIERCYVAIHQAWKEEMGATKLIALECLRGDLGDLRRRRGLLPQMDGEPPR
ncbi:hypothetical protein PSP31120_03666 [Pandoraea sputorum]|nr:hypothetical protein PSP31120_03666 [Pandoraea sputorum]